MANVYYSTESRAAPSIESRFPVAQEKVKCEPSIWISKSLNECITRNNSMSYSRPREAALVGLPYPREAEILEMANTPGLMAPTMHGLYTPDVIWGQAIAGVRRTEDPTSDQFPALRQYIRRGLFDMETRDFPLHTISEQRIYRYAAGGDAMLLEYCNMLNNKVPLNHSRYLSARLIWGFIAGTIERSLVQVGGSQD